MGQSTSRRSSSFFFPELPIFGIPSFCSGVLDSIPIAGIVKSARKLEEGDTWIDTDLKRMVAFSVVVQQGGTMFRISVYTLDSKKILASDADTFNIYSDVGNCTVLEPDKVYRLSLLPGKLDDEEIFVYSGIEPTTFEINGIDDA